MHLLPHAPKDGRCNSRTTMRCDAMRCESLRCDAKRCEAMRSVAKRCEAMRSYANRCDAKRSDAKLCKAMRIVVMRSEVKRCEAVCSSSVALCVSLPQHDVLPRRVHKPAGTSLIGLLCLTGRQRRIDDPHCTMTAAVHHHSNSSIIGRNTHTHTHTHTHNARHDRFTASA